MTYSWNAPVVYKAGQRLPLYDELPKHEGLRCAWSVWGEGDQYGTVNLLDQKAVLSGIREVKEGLSISLDLPVQFPAETLFALARDKATSTTVAQKGPDIPLRDGLLQINTQNGSQWDGLRHFGHAQSGCFYQGIAAKRIATGASRCTDPAAVKPEDSLLGIQNWASHGLHGRGVFLDVVHWYETTGKATGYDPAGPSVISLQDLKDCAAAERVTFQPGDILILRTGWTRSLWESDEAKRAQWHEDGIQGKHAFAGVENSEEMLEWLWNNHFGALVTDSPTFEQWPTPKGKIALHESIIGMFGSPIGEMFDLEKLSAACAERQRWTCFFTANPLNIIGGVASTGNASAII